MTSPNQSLFVNRSAHPESHGYITSDMPVKESFINGANRLLVDHAILMPIGSDGNTGVNVFFFEMPDEIDEALYWVAETLRGHINDDTRHYVEHPVFAPELEEASVQMSQL